VRAVAQAFRISHGKVLMVALAGAVREATLAAGGVPAPLRLLWPVSTRRAAEKGAAGNFLTMMPIWLPCDETGPGSRVRRIAEQTTPETVERRTEISRRFLRHSPPGAARWVVARYMSDRIAPLTATFLSLACHRLAMDGAEVSGFTVYGAPVTDQLCHLTLTKFKDRCELSVVYDEALPCGADLPRLWRTALDELRTHAGVSRRLRSP
jgi:hypothetical protein